MPRRYTSVVAAVEVSGDDQMQNVITRRQPIPGAQPSVYADDVAGADDAAAKVKRWRPITVPLAEVAVTSTAEDAVRGASTA